MVLSTPFVVDGTEYSLRYEYKQQYAIKHNAPKKLFPDEKGLKFNTPLAILDRLDDMDVQIYLIEKGLEWSGSGFEGKISDERAAELRMAYLESGEIDDGSKYNTLLELLADALSLNVLGANGKKLREKGQAEQKKAKVEELAVIYEAKILAEARAKAKLEQPPGTSDTSEQPKTPSDSSE